MTVTTATSEPTVMTETAPAVRAAQLSKVIDDREILLDLTFEVEHGAFIALLGANGAGKSTLLKLLATLTTPSDGTLDLFGRPARSASTSIRSRLGMIGHGAMLYRDLTLLENLVFFGRMYGVASPRERAEALLKQVGLASRALDPVKTMSRGMMQRVSIARALMHDPDLLLADEPFAGLDAPSARVVERMLTDLHASGKTVILANHDIGQSLRLAGRALVLRRGRLAVDQRSSELDVDAVLGHVEGR